ncbi:hypothetical protein GGR53DRAFT_241046 [Hypoxylon sp. FL1150]|nr:hypothetical protein GGR53DRAFT_241046 [Hypoxylon sp. FL1150]
MSVPVSRHMQSGNPRWYAFTIQEPRAETHRRYNARDARRTQVDVCQTLVRRLRGFLQDNPNRLCIPWGELFRLGSQMCNSETGNYLVSLWICQTRTPKQYIIVDTSDQAFWEQLVLEAAFGVEDAPHVHSLPIPGDTSERCLSVVFIRQRENDRLNRIWDPVPEKEYWDDSDSGDDGRAAVRFPGTNLYASTHEPSKRTAFGSKRVDANPSNTWYNCGTARWNKGINAKDAVNVIINAHGLDRAYTALEVPSGSMEPARRIPTMELGNGPTQRSEKPQSQNHIWIPPLLVPPVQSRSETGNKPTAREMPPPPRPPQHLPPLKSLKLLQQSWQQLLPEIVNRPTAQVRPPQYGIRPTPRPWESVHNRLAQVALPPQKNFYPDVPPDLYRPANHASPSSQGRGMVLESVSSQDNQDSVYPNVSPSLYQFASHAGSLSKGEETVLKWIKGQDSQESFSTDAQALPPRLYRPISPVSLSWQGEMIPGSVNSQDSQHSFSLPPYMFQPDSYTNSLSQGGEGGRGGMVLGSINSQDSQDSQNSFFPHAQALPPHNFQLGDYVSPWKPGREAAGEIVLATFNRLPSPPDPLALIPNHMQLGGNVIPPLQGIKEEKGKMVRRSVSRQHGLVPDYLVRSVDNQNKVDDQDDEK